MIFKALRTALLGMLALMRQLHKRVLSAKGISIGKSLPARGLLVYCAHDQTGAKLLLRGKIVGPTWVAISILLELSDIEYELIEVGRIWLLAPDSEPTRLVLEKLNTEAKQNAREFVLVPDVGFVSAGVKGRFEISTLIGPIAIAILSLGLPIFAAALPERTQEPTVEEQITCVLDLPANELRDWVVASISNRNAGSRAQINVSSDSGVLNLEIEQTLGSTQSVIGFVECPDGRSKQLHYRLDSSANGRLIELGQKLNP